MSWYSKTITSSVRDEKSDQIKNLIERLEEAIDGCAIDKENSKNIVKNVIERIEGKGERLLISPVVKNEIKKILELANSSILDSPAKFDQAVDEAIYVLEDYLSTLDS